MAIEVIPTLIEIGTLGVLSVSMIVQKMHYDETYKYRREFDTYAVDSYRQRNALIENTKPMPLDLFKIKEEILKDEQKPEPINPTNENKSLSSGIKEMLSMNPTSEDKLMGGGMKPLFAYSEIENDKIDTNKEEQEYNVGVEHDDKGRDEVKA